MRHDSRGKGNHFPFKTNKEGSPRIQANLVWKLEKSECIDECNAMIQEQLEAGIVERTPPTVEGQEFYIPHKGVVLENAASTKLKVVYDASTQAQSGATSLKECLKTGSPLQNNLWSGWLEGILPRGGDWRFQKSLLASASCTRRKECTHVSLFEELG